MKNSTASILIILIFILILTDLKIYPQGTGDSSVMLKQKRLPVLSGFRFMPTDVIHDPFINTYIKLNLGTAEALDLESYIRGLEGNILDTVSGNISYISGEMEFQFAVNEWLAFNASYGGNTRIGSNTYTILTSGISYTTGFTLGGKARIWQSDQIMLSGSIDYTLNDVFLYSIYDFVKKVHEAGGINDSTNVSMLEKESLPKTFINLNFAYSPADYFGVLVMAGYGASKVFDSKLKGNVRLGAAASIDFLNVGFISFPVGILGSLRYNSFSETGEDVNDLFTYGTRISYTGHKDFDIGIESTYQSLKYNKNDQRVKTILTEFKMLYFF